jgi:threonyl-tRNA synthetase
MPRPLPGDCTLALLTWNDAEGKATMWHSSAHLMAEAIEALYPGTKFGIGPPIENGFYYDIDLGERTIGDGDFAAIEAKMKELAAKKEVYERKEVSKADAIKYFTEKGDEYKLELIDGLEDGRSPSTPKATSPTCAAGPHIPDTSFIKAVKVMSVAGAYWRGDEKRKQLTRLYAITFPKQKELDEYLAMMEEAKKRDHRKLGKELDLFTFSERVGAGLPLWLPKGAALRERLINFMKDAQEQAATCRWPRRISAASTVRHQRPLREVRQGQLPADHTPQEGEEFMLKPMNCPHHCEIFASRPRSYKDLPLRLAEFGTVYRYEQSGELHGLDACARLHAGRCPPLLPADQVKEEFLKVIDLVLLVLRALGFENTRPRSACATRWTAASTSAATRTGRRPSRPSSKRPRNAA